MCGVTGIVSSEEDVAPDLYLGSWALQHRGQEGAGIITYDGERYHEKKGMGTVNDVFNDNILAKLTGRSGIGHNRYATAGKSRLQNVQPIEGIFQGRQFWLAHNGNLPQQYLPQREALVQAGYPFKTTTDTEFIAALVSRSGKEKFEDALFEALGSVEGAYSITALYGDQVFGVRDPLGVQPLVIGEGKGMTVLASESCVCDVLHITTLRSVEPGEMIVMGPGMNGWYSLRSPLRAPERFCLFQNVYFFRPDSYFFGSENASKSERIMYARRRMGKYLWAEHPVDADIVIQVPDSGKYAAQGLAEASGFPLRDGLFRSHNVGRTFIEPLGKNRTRKINFKFNPIPEEVGGKRVVVVDDSIVRANVSRKIVRMLRTAGAREIHMRISSPQYMYSCHYGIDTYRVENQLIAPIFGGDVEEIRRAIGADSLGYLSLENLKKAATGDGPGNFCDACFSGNYPIPIK